MASSEIEKLERLVRENPKGRQFAILADAYRKDGQFQRALDVLAPGLEHHPDYVSARVVLGRVHMAMGDKPKAREAFARVIALDPESVIALKALADLAEEEGAGEEALRWSGQLLAVDPGNEEAIKQTERLTAAAPPVEAAPAAEPRLSGIVPLEMPEETAPVTEGVPSPTAYPKTVEIVAPVTKTVEIVPPVISVQSLAPVFNAAPEPLDQQPEPLPIAPLSDEAATEAIAGTVRPMDALEPTSYEGPADAPTERLAGMDQVGLTEAEIAGIGAASGFEPTSGPIDTREIAAIPLAGLDRPGDDVGAGDGADVVGLEREQDIELGAAGANEFQESSVAETLQRRSGANEFQESSVAETLQRRSGANEFQAPSDAEILSSAAAEPAHDDGLLFIHPPADEPAYAPAPQAPVFTPAAALPPEDPEPAVHEPEPVVTEAMAELYASQGHLSAALEVYRELATRDPSDPRYADRIVELEMFVGGGEVSAVQTFESVDPAPMEVGEEYLDVPPMPVDMVEEATDRPEVGPSAAPVAASLEMMELTDGPEDGPEVRPSAAPAAPAAATWHAEQTGGTPVGAWLSSVFAESLPAPVRTTPPPAAPVVEAPVSAVAPRGAPTRPASGSFSLSNVFGEGGGGAAPKAGSFDDFFGATPTPAPAPAAPEGAAGPSIRRSGSESAPGADDDLASFSDWLKGLKK